MSGESYRVGRGLSDITGEAAECGMLGYGRADQQTRGIHTRLRTRAFVVADGEEGSRVLLIINDLPLVFDSLHQAVLARLGALFGDLYTASNTMITATHTHCGPGGYSHHLLYNSNTKGFRPKTFAALVDGMVEAAEQAHRDVGSAELYLAHGELRDASVNRSRVSFDRNPAEERAYFPDAIDPQTTLLRIDRGGRTVGAINWFPTHNTSMTNRNRLISADNKGYAGYHWERIVHGHDYLTDSADPSFVGAFAQTNAGDMSPNLNLHPGSGPTEDEFENARLIGLRQFTAASTLAEAGGQQMRGPVDHRVVFLEMAGVDVEPSFSGDGAGHRTSGPAGGSASFAGAWADGPAFPGFREGRNPFFDWPSKIAYLLSKKLRDSQAPKGILLPGGALNRLLPVVAQRVPVQLLRIGPLYLIGIPGEVTIVAGLRLRRAVAAIVGADVADVLVAGYSNGYIHYVTTPEEYGEQQYEGASTLFGRWELPALVQTAAALATALRDGTPVDAGAPTADLSGRHAKRRQKVRVDRPAEGRAFGDTVTEVRSSYVPGDRVAAVFVGAHPGNELHRGGTYLRVQSQVGNDWHTVQDDGDWATRFEWARGRGRSSEVTVSWDIPVDVVPGVYRLTYEGDARDDTGGVRPFNGSSAPFEVVSQPA
ncbi:MAG TPA: neutral/alkaline ceramidase [Acidimicrobiales bacterium]